jgi:L-seryl-tRNA(Ser) seleniumtransferase
VNAGGAVYRRLGVEPIINATATVTILGGSLMRPEVLEAMRQASECFVDLTELETCIGTRIAALTRNEAAFVCGGAAAGLFLTAAASMTRGVPNGVLRLTDVPSLPNEFVIHRGHRVPYVSAVELAGGRIVEIGSSGAATLEELETHVGPRTAALLYVAGAHLAEGALSVETFIAVAHAHGLPVIIDAAAQIPPHSSLWDFTHAGADFAIFSGGKGLRGPASTGLIVGEPAGVARCVANAAPLQRLARPMKVGKEDLIGFLTALELELETDETATSRGYEAMVERVVAWGRGRSDVHVEREFPSEAGQPMPRARVTFVGVLASQRDGIIADLLDGRPRVGVWPAGGDGVYVNPQTMLDGEEALVCERLAEVLNSRSVR